MTKEESWEEKAFRELEEKFGEKPDEQSAIHKLLRTQENQKTKVHFAGNGVTLDLNVRAAIPYEMRKKAESLLKRAQDGQISQSEGNREIYEMLADLCLDEEFARPETWLWIDMKTGRVPHILSTVMESVAGSIGGIEKFRKQR